MLLLSSIYIFILWTFFKPIKTLEYYPQCDAEGNVCHLADGRSCDGYKIIQNDNLNTMDIIWMKQKNEKIAIFKKKVKYEVALNVCKAMCGKLLEPIDTYESYYGITKTCYDNSIEDIFIGAIAKKNPSHTYYFFLSNPNYRLTVNDSKFIDDILDLEVNIEGNGNHPLILDTSGHRYNAWGISNYQDDHYFACQKDIDLSNNISLLNEKGIFLLSIC